MASYVKLLKASECSLPRTYPFQNVFRSYLERYVIIVKGFILI